MAWLPMTEERQIDYDALLHEAQLLSYLKLSGRRLGLLINFHEEHLKNGIKRLVNEL